MKREKPKYKDLSRQEDIYNFFRVGEEHFNVLYGPIIKDIKNFCQKRGMLILDLGCGPGTLAIHLARDNHDNRIIGVDLSKGMISFAKSQKNKAIPVNNASFLFDFKFVFYACYHSLLTSSPRIPSFCTIMRVHINCS